MASLATQIRLKIGPKNCHQLVRLNGRKHCRVGEWLQMKHQIAVMDFADDTIHRRISFKTYQASLLVEVEIAFLTLELADLKVEFGAMRGDMIHSVEDLNLGDEVRISDQHKSIAANSELCQQNPTFQSDRHVHLVSKLEGSIHQLQLMNANGSLVMAYAISPMKDSGLRPYLLVPRQFNSQSLYCMIAITKVVSAASTEPV